MRWLSRLVARIRGERQTWADGSRRPAITLPETTLASEWKDMRWSKMADESKPKATVTPISRVK